MSPDDECLISSRSNLDIYFHCRVMGSEDRQTDSFTVYIDLYSATCSNCFIKVLNDCFIKVLPSCTVKYGLKVAWKEPREFAHTNTHRSAIALANVQ